MASFFYCFLRHCVVYTALILILCQLNNIRSNNLVSPVLGVHFKVFPQTKLLEILVDVGLDKSMPHQLCTKFIHGLAFHYKIKLVHTQPNIHNGMYLLRRALGDLVIGRLHNTPVARDINTCFTKLKIDKRLFYDPSIRVNGDYYQRSSNKLFNEAEPRTLTKLATETMESYQAYENALTEEMKSFIVRFKDEGLESDNEDEDEKNSIEDMEVDSTASTGPTSRSKKQPTQEATSSSKGKQPITTSVSQQSEDIYEDHAQAVQTRLDAKQEFYKKLHMYQDYSIDLAALYYSNAASKEFGDMYVSNNQDNDSVIGSYTKHAPIIEPISLLDSSESEVVFAMQRRKNPESVTRKQKTRTTKKPPIPKNLIPRHGRQVSSSSESQRVAQSVDPQANRPKSQFSDQISDTGFQISPQSSRAQDINTFDSFYMPHYQQFQSAPESQLLDTNTESSFPVVDLTTNLSDENDEIEENETQTIHSRGKKSSRYDSYKRDDTTKEKLTLHDMRVQKRLKSESVILPSKDDLYQFETLLENEENVNDENEETVKLNYQSISADMMQASTTAFKEGDIAYTAVMGQIEMFLGIIFKEEVKSGVSLTGFQAIDRELFTADAITKFRLSSKKLALEAEKSIQLQLPEHVFEEPAQKLARQLAMVYDQVNNPLMLDSQTLQPMPSMKRQKSARYEYDYLTELSD